MRKLRLLKAELAELEGKIAEGYKRWEELETKRKALEQVGVPTTTGHPPSWKRDASLLAYTFSQFLHDRPTSHETHLF